MQIYHAANSMLNSAGTKHTLLLLAPSNKNNIKAKIFTPEMKQLQEMPVANNQGYKTENMGYNSLTRTDKSHHKNLGSH